MLQLSERFRPLPFYRPQPLTDLPLIYDREHYFPYPSFGATAATPESRDFRMVTLENEFLRVEVAPELGGRVYSLFDKRIGQEILFSNPVVRPTRILPVWSYISGGIEFNFPIAHSPTSVATVGCSSGRIGPYGFIRSGEREARAGMEWVVEVGLMEGVPALIQRTALRNQSGRARPWMLWSIGAVRATDRTEYIHAPHPVLLHDSQVAEKSWPDLGLSWERDIRQMTALFWRAGGPPQFGVFHHDLGFGLMHYADPETLPGKKLWSYGRGRHRRWGEATTTGGLTYSEIEGGALMDQNEKPPFPHGAERRFEEFWIPIHGRQGAEDLSPPKLALPPMEDPWLGWRHSAWQCEWEAFRAGQGPLPTSLVPTGLDLEAALRERVDLGQVEAAEPLALWLIGAGRHAEALPFALRSQKPTLQRIAGLILWKGLHQPAAAGAHLEQGPLHDAVAVVELDQLYAELNQTARRGPLLAAAPDHRKVVERRAHLALAEGRPADALRLLSETAWPYEHQRYVRTQLWREAQAALNRPATEVPDWLGEDNLAPYGAYWSE